MTELPRLRRDIVIKTGSQDGVPTFDLSVPDGQPLRVGQFMYQAAMLLETQQRHAAWASECRRVNPRLSDEALGKLLALLAEHALIEPRTSERTQTKITLPPPPPSTTAPPAPAPPSSAPVPRLRTADPAGAANPFADPSFEPDAWVDEEIDFLTTGKRQAYRPEPTSSSPPAPTSTTPPTPPPTTTPPSTTADDDDPLQEIERERRRARRRRAIVVAVAAVAVVLGAVPLPKNVSGEVELAPTTRRAVVAPTTGFVTRIAVTEGAWVEDGAVVAELDAREAQNNVSRREAELSQAESELKLLQKGARPEEVQRAAQMVAGRWQAANLAQRDRDRIAKLVAKQLASEEELGVATRTFAEKSAIARDAQAELRLIRAGARPEEVAQLTAAVEVKRIDLQLARTELENTRLRAPIAGLMMTKNINERLNRPLQRGEVLCEIADSRTMRAVARLPEEDLGAVAIGQQAFLKVASLPDKTYEGKIMFISPSVEEDAGFRFFRAEIELQNPERELRPNLSGFIKMNAGTASLWRRLFDKVVRWARLNYVL